MSHLNKKFGRLTGHIVQTVPEQRFVTEAYGREEESRSKFHNDGPAKAKPSPIPQWEDESTTIDDLRAKKAAIEAELNALDKKIADKVKTRKVKKAERPFAAFPATHRDANVTTNMTHF